ncbi:unnamed protein product [Phytophthora fragariaefolia]|uniref:Unnamed protein product n=1 Tax=Phytophthora fragariaefolia TaxID=1490495 RepID=A0A9W6U841_9STRA|nr:unnamed protein product [Phytophthora fragariaefolia]
MHLVHIAPECQLRMALHMHQVLAANEVTMGLEILDEIAEAILDESGEAEDALSGTVLILPKPSRQRECQGDPDHQRFTSYLPESKMGLEYSVNTTHPPRVD